MNTILRVSIVLLFGISFALTCSSQRASAPSLILEIQGIDQTKEIVLKPDDILKVGINERMGEPRVEILVAGKFHSLIEKMTKENIGRKLIIRTTTETFFSGTIREPILKGEFAFFVPSVKEAERIIKKLGKEPDYHLKVTPEELEASKRYTGPLNPWAEKAIKASIDGDYDRAVEFGKKAVQSDPNEGTYHLQLSYYYYQQKKYGLALEEALTAEKLSKKEDLERFPGTYLSIARLYECLTEYEKATEYVNKVLRANKDNLYARSALAEIYEKAGKYDLAVQEYSILSKSDDDEIRKIGLEGIRRLREKRKPGK